MRILVVSPHPDDETLGAGGTLLRYKKEGNQIFWLNITDMKASDGWDEKVIKVRQNQIKAVNEYYQFDGFYYLEYPPTKLNYIEEGKIIGTIKRVFDDVKPEWLLIPGGYDVHSDHRVVHNCCIACSKTFRAPYIKRITSMEIISETDYGLQGRFAPNLFIDISKELEDKLDAMGIYNTEIEDAPFPRSLDKIRALAEVRGGTILSKYAEAFYIVKQIQ